jgi:hypothetical protein
MGSAINVKDGDFVVTRDRWRIECVEAIRVTKQTIFYMDTTWGKPKERRLRLQDVLFSGPKSTADRLREQLVSSYEQKNNDIRGANDRQHKRDDLFIAQAKASVPSTPNTGD